MYEYLKKLLEIAEAIGQVESVKMNKDEYRYRPDIQVEGKTPNGASFTLELTIGQEENNG